MWNGIPGFSKSVFWSNILSSFFLSDPLQSSKDATKRTETWLLYYRREGYFVNLWVSRDRAVCSPLGNMALVRDEAWPWFWNMSRCFQTDLKDILGGEEGIGQRHRAVKPHHSENLLSVNDCACSPRFGKPRKRQKGVCRYFV